MRLYTVHELSGAAVDSEGVEFVHEGFCWPAFFMALPWLVYKRLWLALLLYVVALVLFGVAVTWAGFTGLAALACSLALHFIFAAEANDIHRWTLTQRGYREIAVVSGRNLIEAERDFFRRWSGPSATPRDDTSVTVTATVPVTPGAVWPRRPASDPHGDDHGVLGLFPRAGG